MSNVDLTFNDRTHPHKGRLAMARKPGLGITLCSLMVGMAGIVLVGCSTQNTYPESERITMPVIQQTQGEQVGQEPRKLVPKEGWQEVARWSGTGIYKTEPFVITSQVAWHLVWTVHPVGPNFELLYIFVKDEKGRIVGKASNTEHTRSDFNYYNLSTGAGTFSLVISSGDNLEWEVMVEEPR